MKRMCAVIAEDEPLLRAQIRSTLAELWPDLVICAETSSGEETLHAVERFAPDLAFLDIQMPGKSGLEVAEHIRSRAHIVFITAYDQHALKAFEQGAIDYIVKPISSERMRMTVERLRERIHMPPRDLHGLLDLIKAASVTEPQYIKWLTVPRGSEFKLITVGEIQYLRADNKYTSLFTADHEYLLSMPLKELREKLSPEVFWQVHRSVIVNVGAIDSVVRAFRGTLDLKLKERKELLPVSAAYAHLFKQL